MRSETCCPTVGIQAGDAVAIGAIDGGERAPNHNFSIRLNRNRKYRAVRIGTERGVRCAIGVQSGIVSGNSVGGREKTADHDGVVGLDSKSVNRAIDGVGGKETTIHRAVGIEAGDPGAGGSIDRREVAADDDAPVGLHGQRPNGAGNTAAGAEKGGVQSSVGIKAGQSNARG